MGKGSPGNLLGMQIIRLHPSQTESETGEGPNKLCFNKFSSWLWFRLKSENCPPLLYRLISKDQIESVYSWCTYHRWKKIECSMWVYRIFIINRTKAKHLKEFEQMSPFLLLSPFSHSHPHHTHSFPLLEAGESILGKGWVPSMPTQLGQRHLSSRPIGLCPPG